MGTRFYSSVEYGSVGRNGDADCVYYNANIINNNMADAVGNQPDPQVSFSESRQTPILREPGDYMMSVVQMSYLGALQNLPVFIPRIQVSTPTVVFQGTISAPDAQNNAILTVTNIGSGVITSGDFVVLGQPAYSGRIIATPAPGFTGTGGVGTYRVQNSGFPAIGSSVAMEQVNSQNDVNLTVYSITVVNNVTGAESRVFLKWVPPNSYQAPPSSPVIQQNLSTDYYYAYTYQTVVDMFNVAYIQAVNNIGGTAQPIYDWQMRNTNQSAYVNVASSPGSDPQYSVGLPLAANFSVYMNTALEAVFANFPGTYTNGANGKSFQFTFTPIGATQTYSIQEVGSTNSWCPVVSLTATSNLLPINLEQCATPADVGASSSTSLGAISPGTYLPVVCDDVVDTSQRGAQAFRQSYLNEPMAEYRMISITNTQAPITQIDFQVWWRCRLDNQLYPLRLVPSSSVSLKVLFRRKQMGV